MSSITSCLRKVFCCECCKKKKMPARDAHTIEEVKVQEVASATLAMAPILQARMLERSPVGEPVVNFHRIPHNRFMSTEVISIGTILKE